jgi:hypothetical protein
VRTDPLRLLAVAAALLVAVLVVLDARMRAAGGSGLLDLEFAGTAVHVSDTTGARWAQIVAAMRGAVPPPREPSSASSASGIVTSSLLALTLLYLLVAGLAPPVRRAAGPPA